MKTYILFIFGMFDDQEDIEYFCTQIIGDNPLFKSVRFIVEKEENIIVLFDSDVDNETLSKELYGNMSLPSIHSVIQEWFDYCKSNNFQLSECKIYKNDVRSAFPQINVSPEAVQMLATLITKDLVMFHIAGIFGLNSISLNLNSFLLLLY